MSSLFRLRWRGLVRVSLVLLSACGPDVTREAGEPRGECNAVETSFQNGSRGHIEECSETDYPMNPPVFGDHYPFWAAFQTYDFPIPAGYLVHDLEHGAVVFLYDCPDDCPDEVDAVQTFIDALPVDPLCSGGVQRRTILVPRPGMGARWAAAAWGFSLTAECFDAELFGDFYGEHVGRGPEDLCNAGVAFESAPCN
jgi:hypothetical protein